MPKVPEDIGGGIPPRSEEAELVEKPTKEQWLACKAEVREILARVREKADVVLGKDALYWIGRKKEDFYALLSAEFVPKPRRYKYTAFHTLIGSSDYWREGVSLLDIPEPYSVKSFLLKLRDELDDKEKCQAYVDKKRSER